MLNKIKNIKLSKSKYIYTVIAGLIIIALGVTFAWWRWRSEINALVNGEVCAPEIVFIGGTTINGTDLLPVRTKEEGLSKDINVNLNNTCDNDTAVLNLNLLLDEFPIGLSDASFKWSLYQVTTEEVEGTPTETLTFINDGNFANRSQNDTISLATDLIVTENISTYRLFIWIDALMDNPSAIGDNIFRFKLYGTGTGAIYNQYTMATKSNSSTTTTNAFWGSPIKQNQVKSITFTNISEKPSTIDGQLDISATANSGNILMWWIQNEETPTLYDVYVANTHGGNVKANTTAQYMFAYLPNCVSIDLTYLDTSNTTTFNRMFENDAKLTQINLSNLDTSNNTYMAFMFNGCSKLTSLDLSSFDTRKVTSMRGMFLYCSSLTSLDLSNFYTPSLNNVTEGTQYGMFQGCTNLVTLDLKNFNTSRISDFRVMFKNCSKLKRLDLSNFDTSNATNIDSMFSGCTSLEYLDVSNWSNEKITNMAYLFSGLTNLKTLILTDFNTPNVTNMSYMFRNSGALKTLDLSSFNTSKVTTMASMFYNCQALSLIDLSSFNTSNVTNMHWMFGSCKNLKSLDLSHFNTDKLTTVSSNSDSRYGMFSSCTNLEKLNLSSFSFSKITNVQGLFYYDSKLKEIDLSSADFTNVTTVTNTFKNVPAAAQVIVKDCDQYNLFRTKFGTGYSNLHTVNNDNCTA